MFNPLAILVPVTRSGRPLGALESSVSMAMHSTVPGALRVYVGSALKSGVLLYWSNQAEMLLLVPVSAPRIRSASLRARLVLLPQSFSIRSVLARLSTRLAFRVMSWNEDMPKFLPVIDWPDWTQIEPIPVVAVG